MLNQKQREPNFIEKRRQWNSKVEKPLTRRTLLMVLPALVLSVFLMISAPYLKVIVTEFMKEGEMLKISPLVDTAGPDEKKENPAPPPDPDTVFREEYRARLEAEGFDWRKSPELEKAPDLTFAREQPLPVEPVEVELPNTMTELRAQSKDPETPSH